MTDAHRALSQVERDRVETYLVRERAPLRWWEYLGFALAGGVALAAMDVEPRWLSIAIALLAAVAIGALAGVGIRRAGAVPRLRSMPPRLRVVLIVYWVVAMVGLAAILIWAFTTDVELSFVWAGAAYAVLVIVAGSVADVAYHRRARRLAEEAGILGG
ncbi:MAG TPA: hypothetical protein VK088_10020 [Acidimicrobiia bacterium]|nr:hypothetical protein [Acidimicrobiia bacterium]